MSAKRPHKAAGQELLNGTLAFVTDTVGQATRQTWAYASYSAAQQAQIDAAGGRTKRRSGQAVP